jgi:hypothetical protein
MYLEVDMQVHNKDWAGVELMRLTVVYDETSGFDVVIEGGSMDPHGAVDLLIAKPALSDQ